MSKRPLNFDAWLKPLNINHPSYVVISSPLHWTFKTGEIDRELTFLHLINSTTFSGIRDRTIFVPIRENEELYNAGLDLLTKQVPFTVFEKNKQSYYISYDYTLEETMEIKESSEYLLIGKILDKSRFR